jgi:tetratricopeptide (TPR) repeat protein
MKRILAILSLLFSMGGFACEKEMDWIEHYVLAQEAVGRKDGNTAIEEFTKAIDLQSNKLFLYVQRGQIYEKKHQWEDAVKDFTYVIESPNVHPSILLRALYGRGYCYLKIDGLKNYILDKTASTRTDDDWNRAKAMDTGLVHEEENENYSIEWNVPEGNIHNPEFKREYSKIMVEVENCHSVDDVMFFDNWTIVKKLKKDKPSCQECFDENPRLKKNIPSRVECGQDLKSTLTKINNPTDETDCKWWCDRISESADMMCLEHFKSGKCQYVCIKVVEKTKSWCYSCCAGDGFYKNCVKPFENFLARVGCEEQIW